MKHMSLLTQCFRVEFQVQSKCSVSAASKDILEV